MTKPDDSLRERKRQQTKQALELAAIKLVRSSGLDGLTVEEISAQANVSARTFFNYFESKEDALLGFSKTIKPAGDLAQRLSDTNSGNSTAAVTTRLLINLVVPELATQQLYKIRRQLIKSYPELIERQVYWMARISKQLVPIVQQVSASHDRDELNADQAEILLMLCSSVVRVTLRNWSHSARPMSLAKLEEQAINQLREVIQNLNA